MPSPHVDDEKGKKAMIYKARKDRRKGDKKKRNRKTEKEKSYLEGVSEEDLWRHTMFVPWIFFTLKPNILAQDQTGSLSCTL